MDSDFYLKNQEAAIAGALVADELFLSEVYDGQKIPHYNVTSYDWFSGAPSHIWIDRDANGRADGEANITYDLFGNLKRIEIDRNHNGQPDAAFDFRSEGDDLIQFEYDNGLDGTTDAKGSLQSYDQRYMQFTDTESQRTAGSIYFWQGYPALMGMSVDVGGDASNEARGVIDRYVPESKVTSFGGTSAEG